MLYKPHHIWLTSCPQNSGSHTKTAWEGKKQRVSNRPWRWGSWVPFNRLHQCILSSGLFMDIVRAAQRALKQPYAIGGWDEFSSTSSTRTRLLAVRSLVLHPTTNVCTVLTSAACKGCKCCIQRTQQARIRQAIVFEKQMRQMTECLPVIHFIYFPFWKAWKVHLCYIFLSKLLRTLNNDNNKIENM